MRCSWVVVVAAMVVGCSKSDRNEVAASLPNASLSTQPAVLGQPRSAANIFYSGHSLMDQPMPDVVQEIATSQSTPVQWNRQYIVGSSIQRRTQGANPATPGWSGYKEGYNRDGEGLDVIAELRAPQTIAGPYDVLLITEEHTMLDILMNADTVRLLRHYHERFMAGNPAGTTFFYEPWFSIDDKSNPQQWIAYERAASPIWQCVATRVNVSLGAEGRADRIVSLPTGAALAALIESATQGEGIASITRDTVLDTVNSIVKDDVHLQPLGIYYVSLVTYASVYQRAPRDAWHPDTVTPAQAKALQDFSWAFVSRYYEAYRPLTLAECRERLMSAEGLSPLWQYIRQAYWKDIGALHSYVRYLRRLVRSRSLFSAETHENPFYYDAQSDQSYWLAMQ